MFQIFNTLSVHLSLHILETVFTRLFYAEVSVCVLIYFTKTLMYNNNNNSNDVFYIKKEHSKVPAICFLGLCIL